MALGTYSELQAALANWLIRDDLTTSIPDFITLCESRTNLTLRVREMETSTTLTGVSSVYTLPTDYIEARRVAASTDPVSVLSPVSLDMARNQFDVSGFPTHYTIQGSSLLIWPYNDADVVLDYYGKVPALSSQDPTNWLLTKSPSIYLYGSLIESAPFMEDDNRLATWISLYKDAVDLLTKADTRGVWGKAIARIRGATP